MWWVKKGREKILTKKNISYIAGLTILLLLMGTLNHYALSTNSQIVSVEVIGSLSSTPSQNARLTFFPNALVINTQDKNGNDGYIDIWNSNVTLSIYSDIVEIFDINTLPMQVTLSQAHLYLNETDVDMDIFFSSDTKFEDCTVLNLPSQVRIYNDNNKAKLSLIDGRLKYDMDTTPSSEQGLWEYNFKFWSQSEGTVKIADNVPLGYVPNDYYDYSLKNSSITFKGDRTIFHLTVGDHIISFDNDLSLSAETNGYAYFENGFSGKISMSAITEDSKIVNKVKDEAINDNYSVDLYPNWESSQSCLELAGSVGDYGKIEIELFGEELNIMINEGEHINYFNFNNVDKYISWSIALVSGLIIIPAIKKIVVILKLKEKIKK